MVQAIEATWPTFAPRTVLRWVAPLLPLAPPEQLARYILATAGDASLRSAVCRPAVALMTHRVQRWLAQDNAAPLAAAPLVLPALPPRIGAPRRPVGRPLDHTHAQGARGVLAAIQAAGQVRRPG